MAIFAARFDRGFSIFHTILGHKMYYQNRYYINLCSFTKLCAFLRQEIGGEVRGFQCRNRRSKTTFSRNRSIDVPIGNVHLEGNKMSKNLAKTAGFAVKNPETRTEEGLKRVQHEDFFGFDGGEGVIEVESEPVDIEKLKEKYGNLNKRTMKPDEEKFYVTTFGNIRYDMDNTPQVSNFENGDSGPSMGELDTKMADSKQTKFAFSPIEDQYFSANDSEIREANLREFGGNMIRSTSIDEQYSASDFESGVSSPSMDKMDAKMADGKQTKFANNLIEEQYFGANDSEICDANLREFGENMIRSTSIDEQYSAADVKSGVSGPSMGKMDAKMADGKQTKFENNLIEEQYFGANDSEICDANLREFSENMIRSTSIDEQYSAADVESRVSGPSMGKMDAKMADGQQTKFANNLIEEQYFGANDSEILGAGMTEFGENASRSTSDSYIDGQYFAGAKGAEKLPRQGFRPPEGDQVYFGANMSKIRRNIGQNVARNSSDNYIEAQYFAREGAGTEPEDPEVAMLKAKLGYTSDIQAENLSRDQSVSAKNLHKDKNWDTSRFEEEPQFGDLKTRTGAEKAKRPESKMIIRQNFSHGDKNFPGDSDTIFITQPMQAKDTESADVENPKTAFDYAMKLRREKKYRDKAPAVGSIRVAEDDDPSEKQKLDSKGFRLYTDQVLDLDDEPEMMVLKILKYAALYNENDILAICKPYGLPVHEGAGHRHYLTKFLPDLARHFCRDYAKPQLYTVHRLDKETTGVLLLAKTQAMAKRLSDMFAKGEIQKTYWAITKGVPCPSEGIINIPMAESVSEGKPKMMLKPVYTEETKLVVGKSSRRVHEAITRYKVLASHGKAALVELKPATGVRHQLRVHLASGLACPVLGDHKYSHRNKMAPQKLPTDVLQHLGLRQSKVRTLPMHLHARSIVLPEFLDGRNIHFGARLPKHFVQNMRRLKINSEHNKI